jgi:hypothetical protein
MRFRSIILGAGAMASIASGSTVSHSDKIERSAVFRCKTLLPSFFGEELGRASNSCLSGIGTSVAGAEFGEDVIPGKEVGPSL